MLGYNLLSDITKTINFKPNNNIGKMPLIGYAWKEGSEIYVNLDGVSNDETRFTKDLKCNSIVDLDLYLDPNYAYRYKVLIEFYNRIPTIVQVLEVYQSNQIRNGDANG